MDNLPCQGAGSEVTSKDVEFFETDSPRAKIV